MTPNHEESAILKEILESAEFLQMYDTAINRTEQRYLVYTIDEEEEPF